MTALPRVAVARGAQVTDAGALTAEAYLADRLVAPDDDYERELRDARRRSQEATLLVATLDSGDGRDVVVGTITLAPYGTSYAEVAEPGELELRMLAVAPEARGRGVAEALVAAAQREAVVAGVQRLVLSTLEAMRTAQRLYVRLGFRPEPRRDWAHEDVRLLVHTWTPPGAPGVLTEVACWQPLRTVVTSVGWRVGISRGLTRRANSAVVLGPAADVAAAVDEVEALYAEHGQRPILRLGRSAADRPVAAELEARGWVSVSETDVLVADLPLAGEGSPGRFGYTATNVPDDAWLDAYLDVKAADADRSLARSILEGGVAHHVTARSDGAVVGVIRVAYEQDWAALSCLVVDPLARRAGVGRALTLRALELAYAHGARRAFLQVEAHNAVAARLYSRLGFRPADSYSYCEPATA